MFLLGFVSALLLVAVFVAVLYMSRSSGFLREVLLVLLAACLLALWMPMGGLVVTWSFVVVSVFAAVCVNLGVCGLV